MGDLSKPIGRESIGGGGFSDDEKSFIIFLLILAIPISLFIIKIAFNM